MAVQTVDFANIDTVIKDGVILSDVVLDGATIWTAPPVVGDGVTKQFNPVFTVSNASRASAISGDGLRFAVVDSTSNQLYIYSRPSTNSPNFSLLDTVQVFTTTTNWLPRSINMSHDGSVILTHRGIGSLYGAISGRAFSVVVDDGAGSYTRNADFSDSYTDVSLGDDGNTIAYIVGDTLYVKFNIGTKAAPNWLTIYSYQDSTPLGSVAVSSRNANGVRVATGKGTSSAIRMHIMDQNLQWSIAPYGTITPAFYLDISDDGKTIIASGSQTLAIQTTDASTNILTTKYIANGPWRDVAISGDGSTALVNTYTNDNNTETHFIYSTNTPYDSTSIDNSNTFTGGDDRGALSYDGSVACASGKVYEFTPTILSISSTSSIEGTTLINEGQSLAVTIESRNIASGTLVDYTITGVQAADLVEPLTGSFTLVDDVANLVFNAVSDLTTEGTQTATLTLDDFPDFSLDFIILDSSTTP